MTKDNKYDFNDLCEIVDKLRAPGGCPWDIEQTHESLKHNLIEESYELIEAFDSKNGENIADESGDLLLQIVFHASIGRDASEYSIDDVTDAVCRKLIHRHPHVFGDVQANSTEEVLANWDKIKRDDRGQKTLSSELEGVSKYLPALTRATKIQKKAEKSGLNLVKQGNYKNILMEILNALDGENQISQSEIGEILFYAAALSQENGIPPEIALQSYVDGFIKNIADMENII